LPHIPPAQFPGQSLTVEFYRRGGVRAVEIGSLMFGGEDPNTGESLSPNRELVRLAVPRRVYSNSHLEYVADIARQINADKQNLRGYKISKAPMYLRHFTCELEEIVKNPAGAISA